MKQRTISLYRDSVTKDIWIYDGSTAHKMNMSLDKLDLFSRHSNLVTIGMWPAQNGLQGTVLNIMRKETFRTLGLDKLTPEERVVFIWEYHKELTRYEDQ